MTSAHAWFVAGTDTEIGKTFATCALIHAARNRGLSALGMKPVAAGADIVNGELVNDDAARLRAAGSFDPGITRLNPYCLKSPIAPHIAAADEGITIDPALLRGHFKALSGLADCVFVEGVGGFRVPLGPDYDTADLARDLGLPVILVVGMRLGCINHALLTTEAIRARGLSLAGWIANHIDPDMLRQQENILALRARIAAPLLGILPHTTDGRPETVAERLRLPD